MSYPNRHNLNSCPTPSTPQEPGLRLFRGKYHRNCFVDWCLTPETPESVALRATNLWPHLPHTQTNRLENGEQAGANKHKNVGAGSSRLESPLAPYIKLLTSRSPGWIDERIAETDNQGISETIDVAENQDTTVGEEETPVSSTCHSPIPGVAKVQHGEGACLPSRVRIQRDYAWLRVCVQRRENLSYLPATNKALASKHIYRQARRRT
jgi:hypothetical protein